MKSGGDGAASTRNQSPDSHNIANRGEHEHGSAAYDKRFHHSNSRDEGLLKGRESPTHRSHGAKTTNAALQVPGDGKEPEYEDEEAASDIYLTEQSERFAHGTEMRI